MMWGDFCIVVGLVGWALFTFWAWSLVRAGKKADEMWAEAMRREREHWEKHGDV